MQAETGSGKSIRIIGVPVELGQAQRGVDLGPGALRYAGISERLAGLGYRVEDYGREAIKAAMEHNLYPLQYLLYTVALNRYLSLRVRDYDYTTHFGGVLYVFLRGVSPDRGEEFGYFRDIPPVEMIDGLTKSLIQDGG